MRSAIPNILAEFDAAIWAITPQKYHAIREFLTLRASGQSVDDFRAGPRPKARVAAGAVTSTTGQIAILPLYGCIAHHAGMEMEISGGTSTDAFARAFDEAMNNPDVGAIVIDCDSPGGAVEGVPELAARIFNARGKGKRLVALANANMNSAAYWIASACDDVYAIPSANVGSIGVFCIHTDTSAAEAKAGLKRTVISAGRFKAEAAGGQPLSDTAAAALQARVDECYAMFAGDVAKFRGDSLRNVMAGYGEGRSVSAQQALDAGLIDRIGTLEDVIGDLSGRSAASAGSRRAARAKPRLVAADVDRIVAGATSRPDFAERVLAALAADDAITTDDGACPECGGAMVDGVCADCGYEAPENEADDTTKNTTPDTVPAPDEGPEARGRARDGDAVPPAISPAPQARSSTMSDKDTAAERAALEKQVREQINARNKEIRELCAEHEIEVAAMNGYIDSDMSMEAITRDILAKKREQRKAGGTHVHVGATREEQKPWESLGHFAAAVLDAGTPGVGVRDVRLNAAAQGVNQAIPSEGGFLVPPQFSSKIWDEQSGDVDDLLGMTDNYAIEGESLTMNANAETSRATGSRFGGVQGYWINEADQVTKSKPKFRALRLEPQELGVLIYATDKSLRNSPVALGSYLNRAASEEIKFLSGAAIYGGTGAGQPLGAMNSGSLITVNKETSQANGTILQENISKMWARLHPRARAGAVWMMNVDCEPQLDFLNTVVKNVAGSENVGGYANKVYDPEKRTIKGRPIVNAEYCESLGTKGDIMLVNWGWYASGTRSSGVRSDTSIHLRFDYNETAFRFMYELDGQPWLASALTPFKGSNTLSWAVVLQAR